MEYGDAAERTPKRAKRGGSKKSRRSVSRPNDFADENSGEAEAVTPRLRIEKSTPVRSSSELENSVNSATDLEYESEDYDEENDEQEDDEDEDYDEKENKSRKTPASARKTKTARRRVAEVWSSTQEFDDDIAAVEYIETKTSYFKDKMVDTDEGNKTFYYCGLVTGKRCPAKLYIFLPNTPGLPVELFTNGKEHVHVQTKRGIPEAVKREIRRILEENENAELDDVLEKLAEREMPVPTRAQVKNFTTIKTKKAKVRLPGILKSKNERAESSEMEEVGRKRKRQSRSRAPLSASPE